MLTKWPKFHHITLAHSYTLPSAHISSNKHVSFHIMMTHSTCPNSLDNLFYQTQFYLRIFLLTSMVMRLHPKILRFLQGSAGAEWNTKWYWAECKMQLCLRDKRIDVTNCSSIDVMIQTLQKIEHPSIESKNHIDIFANKGLVLGLLEWRTFRLI